MRANLLLLFTLLFCLTACTDENSQQQEEQLQGTWQFQSASIGGSTEDGELLSGTTFEFQEKTLTSNLLPLLGLPNEKATFELEGQKIIINDDLHFEVSNLEESNMTISFEFAPSGTPMQYEINFTKG